MPPPERTIVSGKVVLFASIGLALFIAVGAMLVALATRRPVAAPPVPRPTTPHSAAS